MGGGNNECAYPSKQEVVGWFVFHRDVTKSCSANREYRLSENKKKKKKKMKKKKVVFQRGGSERRRAEAYRSWQARFFRMCACTRGKHGGCAAVQRVAARDLTARTQRAQRREPNLFHAPLAIHAFEQSRRIGSGDRVSSSSDSLRLFTTTKKEERKKRKKRGRFSNSNQRKMKERAVAAE